MKRLIFVLSFLIVSSISTFGQTLDADLRNHLNKHSLVKIDDQEALRKAKNQVPFKFNVGGKTIQFILRPSEIRSPRYKAEYTSATGVHSLPRGEVFTYTGTLIGERDSVLAFTVDGKITEGFFSIGKEEYYLESAKKYSSRANNDDKVVFQHKDKIKKGSFECGLDEAVAMQLEKTNAAAMNAAMFSPQWNGIKIIELATEADYDWVSRYFGGNPDSANNYILGIINAVNVIYRNDLKLTISVVYQHAWTTTDPYPGDNTENALLRFRNYWNDNFPYSQFPRDAAHLFTGKPSLLRRGRAFEGVICRSPLDSYGLSGAVDFEDTLGIISRLQNLETAHEIGHNLGAGHVDNSGDCANTIMISLISNDVVDKFCPTSIAQITNYVTANISCLHDELIEPARRTPFDFDADGKADIGVFRPSETAWYIQRSTEGWLARIFGVATDKLAPTDYDGDGKTDIAIFRDGIWAIQQSSQNYQGYIQRNWGQAGDIPVPSDFNGDGKAELVVFRPSNGTWYIKSLISDADVYGAVQFGANGDKPLIGDFDNDDKNDLAVFRAGNWYIQLSKTNTFFAESFGLPTDKPVPADYDGDGKTDIAVYRDGFWYLQRSTAGFIGHDFGTSTDIPTPADYDGDGKADISVFRPSAGGWYRINSSTNLFVGIGFGANGDIPVPAFNVVQ